MSAEATSTTNTKPRPAAMGAAWVIAGVGIAGAIIGVSLLRGLIIALLWRWFVVPLGLPSINVAGAIGLSVVFGLLAQRLESDEDRPSFLNALYQGVSYPLVALLIGYLAHLFV